MSVLTVWCHSRVRILDELEPGALYSLWRASVGQYVLDEPRKARLFADHIIWDDFPTQPGQVGAKGGDGALLRREEAAAAEEPLQFSAGCFGIVSLVVVARVGG